MAHAFRVTAEANEGQTNKASARKESVKGYHYKRLMPAARRTIGIKRY